MYKTAAILDIVQPEGEALVYTHRHRGWTNAPMYALDNSLRCMYKVVWICNKSILFSMHANIDLTRVVRESRLPNQYHVNATINIT